jgi:O-antigen/teichoic acid export membrane protein
MELSQYLTQFKIKKLLKSAFLRNVAVIAGGTVFAQLVTIAFSPIITRLYGPGAFGVLGVFLSVVTILSTISSLCYVHAVVLPKEDADGLRILYLSLKIAAIISLISAGIVIPFRQNIAVLLGMEAIAPYFFLVPISVFFAALAQGYDQWLIRKKHFRASSTITIIQSLSLNGLKTGIGFFAPFAVVLIGLSTLGHGIHALLSAVFSRQSRQRVREIMVKQDQGRIRELANEYRDFPYYRTPQVFLNSISRNLPALLLASLFGPASAGLYAIGIRVLTLPSSLISQALGKVFLPRITEAAHRGENMQGLIIKATLGLASVGIIPYGLVIVLGPWLFGLVFGDEWVRAGEYARWLALWLYFGFMNVPSVQATAVLGLQRWMLTYELITVALRVFSLIIGFFLFHSDLTVIILFSIVGIACNCFLIINVILLSRYYSRWQNKKFEITKKY